MAEYLVQDTTLTAIANAVRTKKGTTDPIALTNLATEIESIQTSESESKVALISGTPQTKFYSIEKEDLQLGNTIRDYAFYNCSNMLKADIPDNITTIGKSAFYGCKNLVSITLGSEVKFFRDSYTFTGCSRLVEVYDKTSGTLINNSSILNVYTKEGGSKLSIGSDNYIVYTDEDGKRLISYIGEEQDLVIPSDISIINRSAFMESFNIKSISFGADSSLTEIGVDAFYNCAYLESINNLPSSLNVIGDSAFRSCRKLNNIIIPDGVTDIQPNVFYRCDGLTNITIPNSVISIGAWAFDSCSALVNLVLPNALSIIEDGMFDDCSSLKDIKIPDSVTTIDYLAFGSCTSLTSVTFGESSQLTTIGSDAFKGCSKLASIIIPSAVTSIENNAFYGCTNLKNITMKSQIPPTITSTTFPDTVQTYTVPVGCGEAYRTANIWVNYADKIVEET